MVVMNPKMTEFLAQDRIADLRREAIGQQMVRRTARDTTLRVAPRVESTPQRSFLWRLVHRVAAV
jgi:hypothetical protein